MDWIDNIISAWNGHRKFAEFLVRRMNPRVVVELGVDYGYSTFVFANALQQSNSGIIYGIDLFEGDIHTGFRNNYKKVLDCIESNNLTHVKIIQGEFGSISNIWMMPINILHIDGLHTYEAVWRDYKNWSKFVESDGIILFHDVTAFYDIAKFFSEVQDGWLKIYFTHSAGLGILTKNVEMKNEILANFTNAIDYSKQPFILN
jgi:hypothetical protein